MPINRPQRSASMTMFNEQSCYGQIESILSKTPLTQSAIQRAQKIFEQATAGNVWIPKDPADALGTSYSTYCKMTLDYQKEASDLILQAKQIFYKQNSPISPPLTFEKIEI